MLASALLSIFLSSASFAGLRDNVDRLMRNSQIKGGTVSVSIRDTASGTALVSVNADAPMTPASNMKLITTGAALHALGADFEFRTRLIRSGDKLIVIGDGDPAFGDPELLKDMMVGDLKGVDVEAFLSYWVKAVVDAGISNVSDIVVDDRIFDREFSLASWPGDEPNRYCPQVSGFNFHGNVVEFFPKPRRAQSPDIGPARPAAPWLKITNFATSREGATDKNDLWIARKTGTNDLTFRGNVRFPYKAAVAVNVNDVPEFFARLLADRLSKAGVNVAGFRAAAKDDPISEGTPVGPVICTPISTVLLRCNRDSDNLYAESLVKRIGHAMTAEPGSWTNGTAIIRHIVHQRLNDPQLMSGLVIMDGSGLSASNKLTARTMTAWLDSLANDEKLGPVFIESLAVGGQSGTLTRRMPTSQLRGATVQAKTGYINQVSCLAGYVSMPDGRRRSFAIFVNGFREGAQPAKALQDKIVAAIAEDVAATPAVTLGSD
jgi:D-alanyl-D-alanine carboxypeptidase/D-alanyl-D-alanine-endopeptidase (penicillin-binding protein 4)